MNPPSKSIASDNASTKSMLLARPAGVSMLLACFLAPAPGFIKNFYRPVLVAMGPR
jgi:hypothetical protein